MVNSQYFSTAYATSNHNMLNTYSLGATSYNGWIGTTDGDTYTVTSPITWYLPYESDEYLTNITSPTGSQTTSSIQSTVDAIQFKSFSPETNSYAFTLHPMLILYAFDATGNDSIETYGKIAADLEARLLGGETTPIYLCASTGITVTLNAADLTCSSTNSDILSGALTLYKDNNRIQSAVSKLNIYDVGASPIIRFQSSGLEFLSVQGMDGNNHYTYRLNTGNYFHSLSAGSEYSTMYCMNSIGNGLVGGNQASNQSWYSVHAYAFGSFANTTPLASNNYKIYLTIPSGLTNRSIRFFINVQTVIYFTNSSGQLVSTSSYSSYNAVYTWNNNMHYMTECWGPFFTTPHSYESDSWLEPEYSSVLHLGYDSSTLGYPALIGTGNLTNAYMGGNNVYGVSYNITSNSSSLCQNILPAILYSYQENALFARYLVHSFYNNFVTTNGNSQNNVFYRLNTDEVKIKTVNSSGTVEYIQYASAFASFFNTVSDISNFSGTITAFKNDYPMQTLTYNVKFYNAYDIFMYFDTYKVFDSTSYLNEQQIEAKLSDGEYIINANSYPSKSVTLYLKEVAFEHANGSHGSIINQYFDYSTYNEDRDAYELEVVTNNMPNSAVVTITRRTYNVSQGSRIIPSSSTILGNTDAFQHMIDYSSENDYYEVTIDWSSVSTDMNANQHYIEINNEDIYGANSPETTFKIGINYSAASVASFDASVFIRDIGPSGSYSAGTHDNDFPWASINGNDIYYEMTSSQVSSGRYKVGLSVSYESDTQGVVPGDLNAILYCTVGTSEQALYLDGISTVSQKTISLGTEYPDVTTTAYWSINSFSNSGTDVSIYYPSTVTPSTASNALIAKNGKLYIIPKHVTNTVVTIDGNVSSTYEVDLWSVIPNSNQDTWNSACKAVTLSFKDASNNSTSAYVSVINSTSLSNRKYILSPTNNVYPNNITEPSGTSSERYESYTAYLYPLQCNSSTDYATWFPYPSGSSYNSSLLIKALGEGGNNEVSTNIKVKVHKTTSSLEGTTLASGPYYAGVPIIVNLVKDGEEDWDDMLPFLLETEVGGFPDYWSAGPSVELITGTPNQAKITFPADLEEAETINGFYIEAKNHYGQYVSYQLADSITVNPSVITGVTIYDDENDEITNNYNFGETWYEYTNEPVVIPPSIYAVVSPSGVSNNNIVWSSTSNNILFAKQTGTPSTSIVTSSNESLLVLAKNNNTNRQDYTITAESSANSSVKSIFKVRPLRISSDISSNATSVTLSAADPSASVTLTVNGDETYTSNDSSISISSNISDYVTLSYTVNSNGRDINVTITAKSGAFNAERSGTVTVKVRPHGVSSNTYALTSTITVDIELDDTLYSISLSDPSPSTIYGTEPAVFTVDRGSLVNSYSAEVASGNVDKFQISIDNTQWNTSITGASSNTLYLRRNPNYAPTASSTFTNIVTVTAEQKSSSSSYYASSRRNIILGIITYIPNSSINLYDAAPGNTVTLDASFTPARSSALSNEHLWGCTGGTLSSITNTTAKSSVTFTLTSQSNATVIFTYCPASTGNTYFDYHEFSIIRKTHDEDYVTLDPSTQYLEYTENSKSITYNIITGANVSSVTNVDILEPEYGLTATRETSTSKVVTVSATSCPSNTEVSKHIRITYFRKSIGGEGGGNTSYNTTFENAVILRQGATGHIFSADHTSIDVDGSIGETAVYNITCKYTNGATGQDVNAEWEYDSTYGIHYNSGSGWCNPPSVSNSSISISTKTKNYTTSSRSATFKLRTNYNNTSANYSYLSLTIVQNPMIVELTFDLSTSTSGATINNTSHTASYKFVTRNESNIIFDVLCGYREKRYGTNGTNGTYYDSALNTVSWEHAETSASWFSVSVPNDKLQISANANNSIPGSNRSGTVTLSVQDFGGTGRSLSYTINISQDTFVYSNPSLVISPNPLTLSVLASTASLLVTCTYDASANGQSHQCTHSNWTYSTDINWNDFNISKNAETNNINISCPQNNTNAERTGTITVNSNFNSALGLAAQIATVPVTQEYSTIAFTKANESADYNSHTLTNSISSIGLSWQLTEIHTSDNNNWLSISESSGTSTENLPNGVKEVSVGVSENLVNLAVYSKYRTNTNARTGYIKINDVGTNPVHYSTFNVSQDGYNFTQSASCAISKSKESYEPYDTAGSFTITANYDFDIEKGTGASWCIVNIVNEDKFANTDNASVSKSITINFNLLYNTGGQRNVTFRVKQHKHVNDETDIAVKSFTIVQKSGTPDIKIYSRNTDTEISNYTVDFSSYTALTNEDYKIHSIGGGWEVESKIDTATNLDAGWVSITPSSGSFNTDPTVQPNYYIDTDIRISLDPNSDIERNRTCIVTFRNTVNTDKKVSLTLIQQKADIFLTYDTNINELIRKANNKNAGEIYSSSPSVNFAIDEILCNKQGGTVTYYAFLFTGGSNEAGITFDTYNGMTSSIGTIASSNVDASEIINAEVQLDQSYNYNSNGNAILKKCAVTVFANNDTSTKNLGLKIESTVSTNNITLLFVGQQSGSSYSADGNFEFTGQNTEFALGDFDTATGDRVIPVYGKTYTIAIHNKLQYDSLKITQAYFDSDESLNRDHAVNGVVDTSNWASHGNLPTISANGQGEFTITINPYRIKESLENRDEAFSTDINKKVYRLIVHAKALSQSGDDSSIALENYNAVQYSVNLRQTSWKLLGGEPDANGISKIYSFNTQGSNFPTQSQRYAYSADTGLKVYGSDGVIDETILNQQEDTDIIRILADDTRRDKALDERFGVRNENSN